MKWVIFISLICLVSFAELKNLPRRYRHVEHEKETIGLASQVSAKDFGAISLILFTQSIPNATLEEVKKLSANIIELHQKCVANEHSDPECTKPLDIVFLDLLCHDEEFSRKYGINECCAKADPERNECVLSHKISSVRTIPPFVHPTAEQACQAYHNDLDAVLTKYIYEVSRRYPIALTAVILPASENYKKVLETCCAAADKDACIQEKATEAKKKFREIIEEQKYTCSILKKHGKDTLYLLKFIETHEKFPNANQETISPIVKHVVHIYEALCKGDTVETLLERAELSKYICEHKDAISSNLDQCCEKALVERPTCLITLENDVPSPDLPPLSGEISKTEACKFHDEHVLEHKERFLFIMSRKHPEFSKLLDLEILHKYEVFLDKCCTAEDYTQCIHTGEEQIKLYITKIREIVKNNCNNYKEIGPYFFQNEYLIKYSKIIPQVPTFDLIEFTERITKVAEKCCNLEGDHQVSCALENTDKVLGYICRYHEEHFTNEKFGHCCDSAFISRWECINNLGPDPSYNPPPYKPKALDAPENLCSSNEKIVQKNKQGLLSDFIKSKPSCSDEELAVAILAFREFQTTCCAAENQKECFDTKGQTLVEQIQSGNINV